MKLWQKDRNIDQLIERFTIGNDPVLDLQLAPYDVLGTIAHVTMLEKVGLLESEELDLLKRELVQLHEQAEQGALVIEDGVEDIHSQVEMILTDRLGEVGKKVHTGRSRNDQVLVDLKLFSRARITQIADQVRELFDLLIELSESHKGKLMPGYTHMQIAMPSSFGLWFAAYAESLVDDLTTLNAGYQVANRNPLGSAAGYGSSFPLDRTLTTDLLGFEGMNNNVVYAQLTRGKTERVVAQGLANIAGTLGRMAMDVCLYMGQNFGFFTFPAHLTTGSSIMPHKKNPDVFELIRAKCNIIQALPERILSVLGNLPSGYHRDYQVIKEDYLNAFETLSDCLQLTHHMLRHVEVKDQVKGNEMYRYLFSVELVNELVQEGLSFRDAYHEVARRIAENKFDYSDKIEHTLEGSIGNLNNEYISNHMNTIWKSFHSDRVKTQLESLLKVE